MIDRTELTEALTYAEDAIPAGMIDPLLEAARLLLDFPTDEMVRVVVDMEPGRNYPSARRLLEAVRRVMFGDEES